MKLASCGEKGTTKFLKLSTSTKFEETLPTFPHSIHLQVLQSGHHLKLHLGNANWSFDIDMVMIMINVRSNNFLIIILTGGDSN